eukprot:scaffold54223_cov21-Tisochrysis_lutea.AAC.2
MLPSLAIPLRFTQPAIALQGGPQRARQCMLRGESLELFKGFRFHIDRSATSKGAQARAPACWMWMGTAAQRQSVSGAEVVHDGGVRVGLQQR